MTETPRCTQYTTRFGWSPKNCPRPATGDDGLCNVHRAAKVRSETASRRSEHKWELEQARTTIYRKALAVAHDDSKDDDGGLSLGGWRALSELREAYRRYRALWETEER